MAFTEQANKIFLQAIRDYHLMALAGAVLRQAEDLVSVIEALQPAFSFAAAEGIQLDCEAEALGLKRRIDRSNQDRTDLVEEIDSYFRTTYSEVTPLPDARLNTESPAWAIDRLSILALKIWHMQEQTERKDVDAEHIARCQAKLNVLLEQQKDLSTAIDQLLEDIEAGRKYMKVYRQMKMYNDPSTNPILYKK